MAEVIGLMTEEEFQALFVAWDDVGAAGFTKPIGRGAPLDLRGQEQHLDFRRILLRDGLHECRRASYFLQECGWWFRPGERLNYQMPVSELSTLVSRWLAFQAVEIYPELSEGAFILALVAHGFTCRRWSRGWCGAWCNIHPEALKLLRYQLVMLDKSLNREERKDAIDKILDPGFAGSRRRMRQAARDREKSQAAAQGGTEAGRVLENSRGKAPKAGNF